MSYYTPRIRPSSRLSYQQPAVYNNPVPGAFYSGPDGLRRYHSAGHATSAPVFFASSPSAHSHRSRRHSTSRHGHSGTHSGHRSHSHHRGHHHTSSQPVYVASAQPAYGAVHHRPNTLSYNRNHYNNGPSIGDRIRRLFGMNPKQRYYDSRGHEVDRWGRPVYSY